MHQTGGDRYVGAYMRTKKVLSVASIRLIFGVHLIGAAIHAIFGPKN